MTFTCVDHSPKKEGDYNHIVEQHLEVYNAEVFLNASLCNEIYEE